MFRVNGHRGIGIAIAMRKGGDVLALGRNVEHAMTEITANLPVRIAPTLVADQPVTVEHAVDDFMEALWEALAIVLGVNLVSLGLRAGAVVRSSIPLVLAPVFVTMMFSGIGLQRISLRALIIALGLLADDEMITVEAMVTCLERGDGKEAAPSFAYSSTALPRLTGGVAPLLGAIYTQRRQDRLQRVASEIIKRETVYADFVVSASNLLFNAYTHNEVVLTGDERLIGLINRMRLFAPANVVAAGEAVLKATLRSR